MSMKEKIFSRKISILGKEISAIFIAFAVMGVLGAAIISSYGTSTATVTVIQGITLPNPTYTLVNANTSSAYTYPIEVSNAGNLNAQVSLIGVITNSTNEPAEGVSVSYSPINPVTAVANGVTTVTATITLSQTAVPDTYTITTEVTP